MSRRAAFTLVEMLAVMGIIVLLVAATLPALRGLNQSESRRGAVGNLMGALDRARMMAISDGLHTYVVFACKSSAGTNAQVNSGLWGNAYAIYEDGDNVSFTPVQKTPWIRLPQGIALKVNDDGGVHTSVTNRPLSATDPTFAITGSGLPSGTTGSAGVQLPYWKFDSTGVVDEQNSLYRRLLMFPGVIDAKGNEISTQSANGTGSQQQKSQLEEIDVQLSTGRAKYIVDPVSNLSTPSST